MSRTLLAILLTVIVLLLAVIVWLSLSTGFVRVGFQQAPVVSDNQEQGVLASTTTTINPIQSQNNPSKQSLTSGNNPSQSLLKLVIGNVLIDSVAGKAKITWTTSVSARSQLILTATGQGFDSLNGVGTNHEVTVSKVEQGSIYNFHIEAHTNDGKLIDNYYGQFKGIGPNSAFFVRESDNCGTIQVVDFEGILLPKFALTAKVNYFRNGELMTYTQAFSTNTEGRIQDYTGCSTLDSVSLSGKNLDVNLRPK